MPAPKWSEWNKEIDFKKGYIEPEHLLVQKQIDLKEIPSVTETIAGYAQLHKKEIMRAIERMIPECTTENKIHSCYREYEVDRLLCCECGWTLTREQEYRFSNFGKEILGQYVKIIENPNHNSLDKFVKKVEDKEKKFNGQKATLTVIDDLIKNEYAPKIQEILAKESGFLGSSKANGLLQNNPNPWLEAEKKNTEAFKEAVESQIESASKSYGIGFYSKEEIKAAYNFPFLVATDPAQDMNTIQFVQVGGAKYGKTVTYAEAILTSPCPSVSDGIHTLKDKAPYKSWQCMGCKFQMTDQVFGTFLKSGLTKKYLAVNEDTGL